MMLHKNGSSVGYLVGTHRVDNDWQRHQWIQSLRQAFLSTLWQAMSTWAA